MRFFYIAILLITATSCKKSSSEKLIENSPKPFNATILWYGDPAADGLGWTLRLTTGKIEKPTNLADQFKVSGLKVMVEYEPSSEKFPCHCTQRFINMIRIVSITKS